MTGMVASTRRITYASTSIFPCQVARPRLPVMRGAKATKQSSASSQHRIASSGCALLATTPRDAARDSSRLLDVPEHRLAFQHAGDVLAEAGERDRLAERDVGHVLERL